MRENGHLRSLPDRRWRVYEDYLYALEFSDGRVKLGVTWNPQRRAVQLQTRYGMKVVRFAAHPVIGRRQLGEQRMLAAACRMANLSDGNELFADLRFGDAANLLRQFGSRVHVQLKHRAR